jgi:iron complex outermembrane receptor protein
MEVLASIPHATFHIPQLLAGAVLLGVCAAPVRAQQPDSVPKDTATLPPVVVSGARLPAVGALARGLTGRTATLSASDLDARGVESLADALEQLPGVTTSNELGAGAQLDVSLRGFSVSPVIGLPQGVTVYVDGVRANEPDAHEVNFDLLPLEDVERVDVVYGPSVLLGRNSLGAAVDLVTRRGAAPAAHELELSGGSFGRYELKARAGDRLGAWDYYIGARYEHEDGWRADTRSRIATLFAKLGLLNGTWDATLSYSGGDNRIYQAGSLPEGVFVVDPRANFTGGDYFAPKAHLVILNAQRLVFGAAQLAINGYGRSLSSEQFNANFVGDNSRQRTSARQVGGAAQLSGKLHPGGRELSFLGGVDGGYQHTTVRIFRVPGGAADSLSEAVRTNEVDLGGFVGASLALGRRLTATVAARYDWIRLPFEDLLDGTQSGLHSFRRASPRIGVTWADATGKEVFVSVSRGFRSPALVEIGCADPAAACPLPFALGPDPALKPVVATTYDMGWRYRHRGGGIDASASVYRTDVQNDIFFVASSVTGGYFQNIGATRRAGLELALQWADPRGLRLYVNYGFTTATFQTTADLATTRDSAGETVAPGDRLPMVPDHRVNAGASIPIVRGTGPCCRPAASVGLDGRYVGRQWLRGDEANATGPLADYAVVDGSLTVTWRELELRVMVANLLDRHYANFGTYAVNPTVAGDPVQRWLTPGGPRSFQVSLSTDF